MGRIKEHPILGTAPEKKVVKFYFDGKEISKNDYFIISFGRW